MFGTRSFLTLLAIGSLAGAPALAAQAPEHPRPRAEWRWGRDHWAGHGMRLERRGMRLERHGLRLDRRGMRLDRHGLRLEQRGMRYRYRHAWLHRRGVHRFARWDRRRHFAPQARHRHWDGMI